MSSIDTSPRDVSSIIERYRTIGVVGGLFLGAIVGVMVAGPNFREWSWVRSLTTIGGSTIVGVVAGYIASEIAVGGLAGGPGHGLSSDEGAGSDDSHSEGGASAGDGGSGGDGAGGADS